MGTIKPTATTLSTVADNQALERQYLSFMLSGETNAISILRITEIIQCGQFPKLPWMPNFICGAINLRGAVVPVIDLRARFGNTPTPVRQSNCVIIIEVAIEEDSYRVGMIVDAVKAVLEISESEIDPGLTRGDNLLADFTAGIGKINGEFVVILNIQHILSKEDVTALSSVDLASIAGLTQVSSYKVQHEY